MIYLTADTHGEYDRFSSPQMRKLKEGDTLIVCGDFGFIWDGGQAEKKILKKLGKKKYKILFLDGAHENYDLLEQYPVSEWNGGKVRQISGNLYHLLRGQVYEIEGKKVFAFGGGESEEKQMRMEAGKWWEREMPTMDEMLEGAENLKTVEKRVDYIVTHTPPPNMGTGFSDYGMGGKNQLEAFFEQLVKQVKYEKWFFGSLHIDRKVTVKNYSVFQQILPAWAIPSKHHFAK
ncbi:MAG: metallophosphoesterase [Oscillospiraceae bacterium]|nr:metallophosphoesterase [Oscillospiraceae bacterium]